MLAKGALGKLTILTVVDNILPLRCEAILTKLCVVIMRESAEIQVFQYSKVAWKHGN